MSRKNRVRAVSEAIQDFAKKVFVENPYHYYQEADLQCDLVAYIKKTLADRKIPLSAQGTIYADQ